MVPTEEKKSRNAIFDDLSTHKKKGKNRRISIKNPNEVIWKDMLDCGVWLKSSEQALI